MVPEPDGVPLAKSLIDDDEDDDAKTKTGGSRAANKDAKKAMYATVEDSVDTAEEGHEPVATITVDIRGAGSGGGSGGTKGPGKNKGKSKVNVKVKGKKGKSAKALPATECSKCGEMLEEGSLFCRYCGAAR